MTRLIVSVIVGSLVVAGCSSAASTSSQPSAGSASAPASAVVTASPVAPATGVPTNVSSPGATPFPVKAGEPWIIYQWVRGNGDGIYLMRPDGSDQHLVGNPSIDAYHPDWSPDGSRFAYEAVGAKHYDILVANADGSGATVLVDRNADCPQKCGDAAYPAWSPDGRSIAYVRIDLDGDRLLACAIEVVEVSSGARRVVHDCPPNTVLEYPRWSADGRSLVVSSALFADPSLTTQTGSTISVIDATTANATPRLLTEPATFATYPDWHPTGDLILFTTYDLAAFQGTDEASNLYTIKADGSGLTAVTKYERMGERATQPTWTPDGQRIMFTLVGNASGFDGPRQAASIDADGTDLVTAPGEATHPRLRPLP